MVKKSLTLTLSLVLFTGVLCVNSLYAGRRDPLVKVAKSLGKNIKKMKLKRVGVLAFPYHDGRLSSGSSIVSEKLTTHLVGVKGLRVVERRLIQKLLEEQHLEESGVIDPTTAKKIGNLLGVDIIVTGTLIDLDDDKTEVNARGLLSGTGEIIAAQNVILNRTWKDRPRSARARQAENIPESVEPEKKKVDDEPIKIGYPAGGGYGGGYRGGYRGGYGGY